jgi:alpha-1,2-mannosyltransferase
VLRDSRPFDFDINWVAGHRLVDCNRLYDTAASRAEAVRLLGPSMRDTFRDPFTSFVGLPVVALVHAPFSLLHHDDALALFRLLSAIAMVGALALVARTLAPGSRLAGLAIGLGALLLCEPALWTLGIGQANGLVMLGFAVAIWASQRGRWRLAGVGIGVAAALKLSPVLVLVYLALRGKWRAARWGAGTVLALSAVSPVIGRPGDLLVWIKDVFPEVSAGTLYTGNQSVVAWLARTLTGSDDLLNRSALGPIHYLGLVIAAAALVALWRMRRHAALDPLELGVLILVVLVAGPLSWDHYFVWAAIPLATMIDARYWRAGSPRRNAALALTMAVAVLLFAQHVRVPNAAAIRADWSLRLTTTPYALGGILLLVCAAALLRHVTPAVEPMVEKASVPRAATVPAMSPKGVRTSVR